MSTKIREQSLKKLALIEEKKRRIRLAKPRYTPRPGQLAVLSSKAKNVFNFSGNGGGKSTINVQFAYNMCRGLNPWSGVTNRVPINIIFVVDTSRKIEERIIPEFKKWFHIDDAWLKRLGKPYTSRIEFDNGSVIDFYSSDADPASFEGIEASVVIVDEPIPRPLYVALKRSLRRKGHPCRFIFSGTAISEAWLRKEIYEPWAKGELPDTECFRLSSEDNKDNLAEGYLEDFARSLSEAEREVRLKGGFFDTEALALGHLFDRKHHIIDAASFKYSKDMPCVVAIDNHSVKPHHAVMLTCTRDNNLIAIKELSYKGSASQFAAVLEEWEKGYNIVDRVCDSLGSMDTSSGEGLHSFIEGLRACGVSVRPTTFKEKSHEDLIDRMRQGLQIPTEPDNNGLTLPKLRLLSTMTGLISDIESATWQKNRMTGELVPKLDTSTKDHLSCLGYALALHLFYDISNTGNVYRSTPSIFNRSPEARRSEVLEGRRNRAFSRRFRKR